MLYRFGEFELDTEAFELRRNRARQHLEPLVFDFLSHLVANAGRIVSRDEVVEQVWNGRAVSEATISGCVKSARKALGDTGESQTFIKTIRGRGFQFLMPEGSGTEDTGGTSGIASEQPVIAVLPFSNLSAEFDEYFADGLTGDILTNLARFRDLLVIGRTSTFRFKGEQVSLDTLREQLNAGYVVEGSVRRAAGRVRISCQLIDAVTGGHLWADNFDREMEDIFSVQDEVTRTIAAALGVKVQDAAQQRAMKKNRAELDAYDCVLRARPYTVTLSAEMHADARDLLETAVRRDPSNADAHALLANVYLAEHRFGSNPRPDPIGRALAMAEKAVHLDPQNAYARCWLAIVHFFQRDNDKFEAEARRALALNPNDPEILADIGHFLAFMGEFERGLELSLKARELNPLHPGWYHFSTLRFHYDLGNYAEVLADIRKIAMPEFYWSHLFAAAALGQLDRREDAAKALAEMFRLKPDCVPRDELVKWNAAPEDLEHLLEGLAKAGLKE